MPTRMMVQVAFLVLTALVLPSQVAAQWECEDCGEQTHECLPVAPHHQITCIEWDNEILGQGCDASPSFCGMMSQALDVTGLPAPASRVASVVPETATWLRSSCDATVLRFSFNREETARMNRETELITL